MAPKPVAGSGAPKTEVVVTGCVVFCPNPPKWEVAVLVVPRLPNMGLAGC